MFIILGLMCGFDFNVYAMVAVSSMMEVSRYVGWERVSQVYCGSCSKITSFVLGSHLLVFIRTWCILRNLFGKLGLV